MTTIDIFKRMLDWIFANTDAKNQTNVARKAGLNETTVSRIMKGRVKSVKPETLRDVNKAFGNVFNPEWMRGESDVMLVADLARVCTDRPAKQTADPTAALLAAKDEIIASLKHTIAAKDDIIAAKDGIISTKDKLIDTLRQQIGDLRMQAASEKGFLKTGHSHSAAAERSDTSAYSGK